MVRTLRDLPSFLLIFFALLAVGSVGWAQQNVPHIGYVYPAGGQQGDTFQVKIGGQFLDGVAKVYVSGSGVQAAVVEHVKPLTQKQINDMREKLQELQKKAKEADFGEGGRAVIQKEIAELRQKLAMVNRNANPVIAEIVTLEVTMAANAEPGARQLRLGTLLGLSNPLVLCVGQLPESCEMEPKSGEAVAEMKVTLPAVVNGRIIPGDGDLTRFPPRFGQQFVPGDVDRYRFEARQGQQLVVTTQARELIPYLADAVPGWFQAVVTLYDAEGNELAYDDDYRFHPDPVLHYEIPNNGEYIIEIKDAIYRGREDFVYRITLGELPFVTSIFPLGGQAGSQTTVDLTGWNLPIDKLTMDATDGRPGVRPLFVRAGELVSNRVPFAVDTLPECVEEESNDESRGGAWGTGPGDPRSRVPPASASQAVTLPIIVNGRIGQPGDWDVFRFEGRSGDRIVAEVQARRLDSPLDSVLRLTDAAGRQVAVNDDHEDKGSGLDTHHADSLLIVTLPAGVGGFQTRPYYLHLGDAQRKGGPEYAYRLRISLPRPDFDLLVVPSNINAGAGQIVPITVYALRKDGFSGDISLALRDAPKGFALSGAWVPAPQDHVRLTLTLPPVPLDEPISLSLEGRATVAWASRPWSEDHGQDARATQEVVRPALPADDMMQAFAYRHLVPTDDLKVAVTKRGATRSLVRILGEQPVRIPAGGTARVQVAMPAARSYDKVQFELSEPPEGVTVREVSQGPQGVEIVLQCDASKAKPGLKGNLIVNAFGERSQPATGNQKAQVVRRRVPLGMLPAIAFEIVE